MDSTPRSSARAPLALGIVLLLLAFGLMRWSLPPGVSRQAVEIEGPGGRPCGAMHWQVPAPKAVLVMGHGVSTNRGVMASLAKAYAGHGYAVIALDFWGHGRSRQHFDWSSNAAQLHAWLAWAKAQYPALPLAYLGHSMGGVAGAVALNDSPEADAFVSLGMLPRDGYPAVKTLIAAGQFEELFRPEQAHASAAGKADVLISPWSDHVLETWDATLIRGMVDWTDSALGVPAAPGYSWWRWRLALVAGTLGLIAALLLATGATALLRGPDGPPRTLPESAPRFSLNPYRLTARLLRLPGGTPPPRTDSFARAAGLGLLYSLVFIVPLSFLLTDDIFVSRLDHPARLLAWGISGVLFSALSLLDKRSLEHLGLEGAWQRFAVSALTRATPLLALGLLLENIGPGIAFSGMLLIILAFVMLMLAIAYATASRAAGDTRTGAIANGLILGWVFSFWFPLVW